MLSGQARGPRIKPTLQFNLSHSIPGDRSELRVEVPAVWELFEDPVGHVVQQGVLVDGVLHLGHLWEDKNGCNTENYKDYSDTLALMTLWTNSMHK